MNLTDELLGALSLLIILWLTWIGWRWARQAQDALEVAKRLRWQRDCLEEWLNANGWRVSYTDEQVRIARGAPDPEEVRLRHLRREKE